MRKSISAIVSLCTIALVSCTAVKKTSTSQHPLKPEKFRWQVSRTGEIQYLLYLPKDYAPGSQQRWPLMLFLHGAGERGANVWNAAIHGPPSLVKQGKEFPFILVAPLCPAGQQWSNDPLLSLLDHLTARLAVDTNRIYLTGLSMGGYGTWSLALAHPEKFAAIAPICGGGKLIDVLLAGRDKSAALKSLAVWAFHGAKDPVVPLDESERMVAALKRVGAEEVRLTVYPEAQHNSWTETYKNPELYEWFLRHTRQPAAPPKR